MSPSFGGLVILEHRDRDGEPFCSLYAHLSPFLCVEEGAPVEKGEKIGSLGRSYTFENGGYRAHLHFGIHRGPYGNGNWVTGYLRPERFQKGDHGWVDPQAFVRERFPSGRHSDPD